MMISKKKLFKKYDRDHRVTMCLTEEDTMSLSLSDAMLEILIEDALFNSNLSVGIVCQTRDDVIDLYTTLSMYLDAHPNITCIQSISRHNIVFGNGSKIWFGNASSCCLFKGTSFDIAWMVDANLLNEEQFANAWEATCTRTKAHTGKMIMTGNIFPNNNKCFLEFQLRVMRAKDKTARVYVLNDE